MRPYNQPVEVGQVLAMGNFEGRKPSAGSTKTFDAKGKGVNDSG